MLEPPRFLRGVTEDVRPTSAPYTSQCKIARSGHQTFGKSIKPQLRLLAGKVIARAVRDLLEFNFVERLDRRYSYSRSLSFLGNTKCQHAPGGGGSHHEGLMKRIQFKDIPHD